MGRREPLPRGAQLGRYLTWLAVTQQLDAETSVASRLARPLVAAFVEHLLVLNTAQTVISRLNALDLFARAVLPNQDWRFLRQLQQRLRPRVRGQPAKGRPATFHGRASRARQGADERRASGGCRPDVGTAGHSLPRRADDRPPCSPAATAEELYGDHDRPPSRPAGRLMAVRFSAGETKNKRPIEVPFPKQLVQDLDLYLERARPALLRRADVAHADDGRLWLCRDGGPLTDRRVHRSICNRTKQAFGRSVYPHLFRDAAATTLALEDPGHVRIAASILVARVVPDAPRGSTACRAAPRLSGRTTTCSIRCGPRSGTVCHKWPFADAEADPGRAVGRTRPAIGWPSPPLADPWQARLCCPNAACRPLGPAPRPSGLTSRCRRAPGRPGVRDRRRHDRGRGRARPAPGRGGAGDSVPGPAAGRARRAGGAGLYAGAGRGPDRRLRADWRADLAVAGLARDCPRYSHDRYAALEPETARRLPLPSYCSPR